MVTASLIGLYVLFAVLFLGGFFCGYITGRLHPYSVSSPGRAAIRSNDDGE